MGGVGGGGNGTLHEPELTRQLGKIQYGRSHSVSRQSYFSRANHVHESDLGRGVLNVCHLATNAVLSREYLKKKKRRYVPASE